MKNKKGQNYLTAKKKDKKLEQTSKKEISDYPRIEDTHPTPPWSSLVEGDEQPVRTNCQKFTECLK